MIRLALLFLLACLAPGCAPKSVDDYHTAENEEQIVRLLNEREYGKVIWLIESREGKKPAQRQKAFLLGQAYLGQAGIEPLALAARVGGAQDASSPEAQALLPSCPSAPLSSLREADPLCLLKRVYFQVPDPDVYEMSRARELFRFAYPDASASPAWVNILVGALETASLIRRTGSVFLFTQEVIRKGSHPSDDQLRWLARQLKLILDDAVHALERADHTGNKISQILTGSPGAIWFERASGAVQWAEKLGIGRLFDGIRSYALSSADEATYGEVLDKIRAYLDEQDKRIAALR
jgi:hypothetical protein